MKAAKQGGVALAGNAAEGRLAFSGRCGRVRLTGVVVRNRGIDWTHPNNVYWQHQVRRLMVAHAAPHASSGPRPACGHWCSPLAGLTAMCARGVNAFPLRVLRHGPCGCMFCLPGATVLSVSFDIKAQVRGSFAVASGCHCQCRALQLSHVKSHRDTGFCRRVRVHALANQSCPQLSPMQISHPDPWPPA